MEKRSLKRIITAGLIVVMCLIGILLMVLVFDQNIELRFHSGGGQIIQTHTSSPGERVNLEQSKFHPIRPGWVFMGWTLAPGSTDVITDIRMTRTQDVYAHWIEQQFIVRHFVEGVNYRNIPIEGGQEFGNLLLTREDLTSWNIGIGENPASVNTAFNRFYGWQFQDLLGNKAILEVVNHGQGPEQEQWWLNTFGDAEGNILVSRQRILDNHSDMTEGRIPFRVDLYDTTFNAILGYRRVALTFQNSLNPPMTDDNGIPPQFLYFNQENPITLPGFQAPVGSNRNFIGWRIDVMQNGFVDPGAAQINLGMPVTAIPGKPGHPLRGVAQPIPPRVIDRVGVQNDLDRLNGLVAPSRIFAAGESFFLDSILYYVSGVFNNLGGQQGRQIRFIPVFFGEGTTDFNTAQFYLRMPNEQGNPVLRGITENSNTNLILDDATGQMVVNPNATEPIPARYIREDRIVLYRPANRGGYTFLEFAYFQQDGTRIVVDGNSGANIGDVYATIYLNDLQSFHLGHASIIDVVFVPTNRMTINFDFGHSRYDNLQFINRIDFERNDIYRNPLAQEPFPVAQGFVGDTIILPSASMYVMPGMIFSHWEVTDSQGHLVNVGTAGMPHVVRSNEEFPGAGNAYTLRAIWVEDLINFGFDLNGGGWRENAPDMRSMRGRAGSSPVEVPANMPGRFGYVFHGWRVGGVGGALHGGDEIIPLNQRQVLVANWQPISLDITLAFNFVDNFGVEREGTIDFTNIEFDSTINLRRVRANDTPRGVSTPIGIAGPLSIGNQYIQAVRQTGWRFENANIDFPTEQQLTLNESFVSRYIGTNTLDGLEQAVYDSVGNLELVAHDLKEGRLWNIQLWDGARDGLTMENHVTNLRWTGTFYNIQNGVPTPQTARHHIRRDSILSTIMNRNASANARLEAYLRENEFIGFLYVPEIVASNTLAGTNIAGNVLLDSINWNDSFNIETGGYGFEHLTQYRHYFNHDGYLYNSVTGEVGLTVQNQNMRLFMLWQPRTVTIEINAIGIDGNPILVNGQIPTIQSYIWDERPHSHITNDGMDEFGVRFSDIMNDITASDEDREQARINHGSGIFFEDFARPYAIDNPFGHATTDRFTGWRAIYVFEDLDGNIFHPVTRIQIGVDEFGNPVYENIPNIGPTSPFNATMNRHIVRENINGQYVNTHKFASANWFFTTFDTNLAPQIPGESGFSYFVSRIILTRVVQDRESFVITVEDTHNFHDTIREFGIENDRANFDEELRGTLLTGTLNTSIDQVEFNPIALEVDGHLQQAAARRSSRVVAYSTEENAGGEIFLLGTERYVAENIADVLNTNTFETTPMVNFHYASSPGQNTGHLVGLTPLERANLFNNASSFLENFDPLRIREHAFMDVSTEGSVTLFPIYDTIDYRIVVFYDQGDYAVPNPNRGRIDLGYARPGPTGIILNTPNFGTPAGNTAWQDVLNRRFGHFVAMDTFNLTVNERDVNGNLTDTVIQRYRLNQNQRVTLADRSTLNELDLTLAIDAVDGVPEIHLQLDWVPMSVEVVYNVIINGEDRQFVVNKGPFGREFNLHRLHEGSTHFPEDIRRSIVEGRLGYNIHGWSFNQHLSGTDIAPNFEFPLDGNIPLVVRTGQPGALDQGFVNGTDGVLERVTGTNVLRLNLHAHYIGVLFNVDILLQDRLVLAQGNDVDIWYLPQHDPYGVHFFGPDYPTVASRENRFGTNEFGANRIMRLTNVEFGSEIRMDWRESQFVHANGAILGNWYHITQSGTNIRQNWIFPTVNSLSQTVFTLSDEALIDTRPGATFNQPVNNIISGGHTTNLQIWPNFARGTNMFFFDHMQGVSGRDPFGENAANVTLINQLFETYEHAENTHGTTGRWNYVLEGEGTTREYQEVNASSIAGSPGTTQIIHQGNPTYVITDVPGDNRYFRYYYDLEIDDVISTFLVSPSIGAPVLDPSDMFGRTLDNRFIRWGHELVGFRAFINGGDHTQASSWQYFLNPDYVTWRNVPANNHPASVGINNHWTNIPLARVNSSNSGSLAHRYVMESRRSRPTQVTIEPIWHAFNVVLNFHEDIDTLVGHGLTALNLGLHQNFINTTGIANFEQLRRTTVPIGTNKNLPLISTPDTSPLWHHGFERSLTLPFTGNSANIHSWQNFTTHTSVTTLSPEELANLGFITEYANRYTHYDRWIENQWPHINLKTLWFTTRPLQVNFNIAHFGGANGNEFITRPLHLNAPPGFAMIQLKPTIAECGTRYLMELEEGAGGIFHPQMIHEWSLPTLDAFSADIDRADIYGMVSRGWHLRLPAFGSRNLAWNDFGFTNLLGQEGARLPFVAGHGDVGRIWDPQNHLYSGLTQGPIGGGALAVEMYLLFDYARGDIEFHMNGGVLGAGGRSFINDVRHNDNITIHSGDMLARRRGYRLLGFRFAGHLNTDTSEINHYHNYHFQRNPDGSLKTDIIFGLPVLIPVDELPIYGNVNHPTANTGHNPFRAVMPPEFVERDPHGVVVRRSLSPITDPAHGNTVITEHRDGGRIILEAVWEEIRVEVIFIGANGREMDERFQNINVRYYTGFLDQDWNPEFYNLTNNTLMQPRKPGHSFVGWYTHSNHLPINRVEGFYDFRYDDNGVWGWGWVEQDPQSNRRSTVVGARGINFNNPIETVFARFVPNTFVFNFNATSADLNPGYELPISRPLAGNADFNNQNVTRNTGSTDHVPNYGFRFGTRNTLLPMNVDTGWVTNPVNFSRTDNLAFAGWSLDASGASGVINPRLSSQVQLGNQTTFIENSQLGSEITLDAHGVAPLDARTDGSIGHYQLDVDTEMLRLLESGNYILNTDGSRTFTLNLHAVWSRDFIHIDYIGGAGAVGHRQQMGYLFAGNERLVLGGNGAETVDERSDDYRTFGLMVFDDTGFHLEGHNFLGWLPMQGTATNPIPFASGELRRIFKPGEFLPSVSAPFLMVAQWVPWTAAVQVPTEIAGITTQVTGGNHEIRVFEATGGGFFNYNETRFQNVNLFTNPNFDANHPSGRYQWMNVLNGNTRILSIPGANFTHEGTAHSFGADHFERQNAQALQLETSADIILFPRGLTVLPRESIVAPNAIQINLPTYRYMPYRYVMVRDEATNQMIPMRTDFVDQTGLMVEARAIIAPQLTRLHVNDALIGVDLGQRTATGVKIDVDVYNPQRTVFNIIAAEIIENGNAHVSRSALTHYTVNQGQLELYIMRNEYNHYIVAEHLGINGFSHFSFQTRKYRFEEFADNFGILYSRTHDNRRQEIEGTYRELIAFPSARRASTVNVTFDIHGDPIHFVGAAELSGVAAIRTYAFMNLNNVEEIRLIPAVTGTGTFTRLERRAFYHTTLNTLRLPSHANSVHREFFTGFNPFIETVTFGNHNTRESNFAYVRDNFLYFGDGLVPNPRHDDLIYLLASNIHDSTTILDQHGVDREFNPYSLYTLTRRPLTELSIMGRTHFQGRRSLVFEHFMAPLPSSLRSLQISTNVGDFDWRIVRNHYLPDGLWIDTIRPEEVASMRFLNVPRVSAGAGLAVTDPAVPDEFPVFVPNTTTAVRYQEVSQLPGSRQAGNSRFQTYAKDIQFNRGNVFYNPALHGPSNPAIDSENHPIFSWYNHFMDGDITFGNELVFPDLPEHFFRDGYSFMGWAALQSDGLLNEDHLFQPGESRTIAMDDTDSTIYIQEDVVFVAFWQEVLVSFIGRTFNEESGEFNRATLGVLDIYRAGVPVAGQDWNTPIGAYHQHLANPGSQIFLPATNHSFIGSDGIRYQFVGWRAIPEDVRGAPFNPGQTWDNEYWWLWEETAYEDRVFADGSSGTIFQLVDTRVNFYALYDRASSNVAFTPNLSHAIYDTNPSSPTFGERIYEGNNVVAFTAHFEHNSNRNVREAANISIPAAIAMPDDLFALGHRRFMMPVTHIADRAFINLSQFELGPIATSQLRHGGNIYIGENIRGIGVQAFERTHATSITFANTVFRDQNTLTEAEREVMTQDLNIGANAFAYNFGMAGRIYLPARTTIIGARAFIDNPGVSHVLLSDDVSPRLTTIGSSAFEGMRTLEELFVIPATVTHIGNFAFTLTNIQSFETENDITETGGVVYHATTPITSSAFIAIDGNLFRHNRDLQSIAPLEAVGNMELIIYAPGNHDQVIDITDFTFDFVTGPSSDVGLRIGNYAFAHHAHLQHVIIPEWAQSKDFQIGSAVFSTMRSLQSIIIVGIDTPQDFLSVANADIFRGMPPVNIHLVNEGIHTETQLIFIPNLNADIITWADEFPGQARLVTLMGARVAMLDNWPEYNPIITPPAPVITLKPSIIQASDTVELIVEKDGVVVPYHLVTITVEGTPYSQINLVGNTWQFIAHYDEEIVEITVEIEINGVMETHQFFINVVL